MASWEMDPTIQSLSDLCRVPIKHQLKNAANRGASVYIYGPERLEMTRAQLFLLALLDGLARGYIHFCQILMEASCHLPQLHSPSLVYWLREDFSFGDEVVSNAQRMLQKYIRKGELGVPGYVFAAIMSLGFHEEKQSRPYYSKHLSDVVSFSSRDSAYTSSESEDSTPRLKHLFKKLSSSKEEDCMQKSPMYPLVEEINAELMASEITGGEEAKKRSSLEQSFQPVTPWKGCNAGLEKKQAHGPKSTKKDEDLLGAVWSTMTLIVNALIQAGVSVNFKFKNGNTPLHLAAFSGDEKTIDTLLGAGASVKMENDEGYTALHLASTGYAVYAIVAYGADVNSRGSCMTTPLHLAIIKGNVEVVKALMVMEASTDEQDSNGDTALHVAARTGNLEILTELLNADGCLEVKNNSGHTPLHMAARAENIRAVKELILAGANIEAKDKEGHTVAFSAAVEENLSVLLMLCNWDADLDATDLNGSAILHALAKAGSREVMEWLLAEGAEVDKRDKEERTPLYLAAKIGDVCMAQALISYGADVEAIGESGYRPLHIAAAAGDSLMVGLLLDQGASVHARDQEGATPLHHAAAGGYLPVIDQLLAQGACTGTSDISGRRPIDKATAGGHQEVVDHLLCLFQSHLPSKKSLGDPLQSL